jgi:CubicO group peptidase (beta-lactamase class C family)
MRERIFDPLGMRETNFHVPPGEIDRLPAFYFFNRRTSKLDFLPTWQTVHGSGLES